MAKKYLTPDFDVTVYEVKDVLTLDYLSEGEDPDNDNNYQGGLIPEE